MPQKTSLELLEERNFLIKTAENVAKKAQKEGLALTDEEVKETDAMLAEAESLTADIEKMQRAEKQLTRIEDAVGSIQNPDAGRKTTTAEPADSLVSTTPSKIPAQYNKMYGKLKAFTGGTNPEQDRYDAFESGMWIRAMFFRDAIAHRWCDVNGVFHRLAAEEGSGTAGGNLVPSPLLDRIIVLRDEFGTFRAECDLVPMGRDTLSIPKLSTGTTASFFAESATIGESDPVWLQVNLTAKKLGIITRISNELAEDAVINLADWLAMDMARAFALKEDEVGFAGTGVASDGGIVGVAQAFTNGHSTSASPLAGAVNASAANDDFVELDATDMALIMAALPAYARSNAKWYCSSVCQDLVFNRLANAGGGQTVQTFRGELGPSFLGHSVVTNEQLPSTTTAAALNNSTMLLFGDLRLAAVMGDRRGITVASSADRYFEVDQVAIRATERFDIAIHGLGDATTAGPIVALIGQT